MITMVEIDDARAYLDGCRARLRNPSTWPRIHADAAREEMQMQHDVRIAEERVEERLRQWWAQGCKEVTP
jgi:hypothetical protein